VQTPEWRSARLVQLTVGGGEGRRQDDEYAEFVAVISHLHNQETVKDAGLRLAEVKSITERLQATLQSNPRAAAVFATDFNCCRRQDYNDREWSLIAQMKSNMKEAEVEADGVAEELQRQGFVCAYGAHAPVLTHWTSTTVDFAYFLQPQSGRWRWSAGGSYVVSPKDSDPLSDHCLVVHDFILVRGV
jgi:hypothetical protein